jgi:hypothetical protein
LFPFRHDFGDGTPTLKNSFEISAGYVPGEGVI